MLAMLASSPGCSTPVTTQSGGDGPQQPPRVRAPEVLDGHGAEVETGPCPPGMVLLEPTEEDGLAAFCLGEVEVSVAEFRRCVDAGKCDAPQADHFDHPEDATWLMGDPELPINHIGGDQGTQYCAFVGGRLATAAEWRWAAESGKDWEFPWGNRFEYDKEYYCGSWRRPGQKRRQAIACHPRQYPTDRTEQGVYDMAGSLDEVIAPNEEGAFGVIIPPAPKAIDVPDPDDSGYSSTVRATPFYGWAWMYSSEVGLRCATDVRR